VTWLVALLTLTAFPARSGSLGVEAATETIERLVLPPLKDRPTLKVRALDSLIVLEGRGSAELARALRKQKRVICPTLEEFPGEVRLHCASPFLVARLEGEGAHLMLAIRHTRVLPWDGIDGPPLVPFDPPAAFLGDACPGSTPAGRAECLLLAGNRVGARAALDGATEGVARAHADLRLGDLAFAEGDVESAVTLWNQVDRLPYQALAAARLCEVSQSCLEGVEFDRIYGMTGLPEPLARDLALRHARALAFLGRPIEAARVIVAASYELGACAAAPALCQRIIHAALLDPAADGEVLSIWSQLPERNKSPDAWETDFAVGLLAERLGAPGYAASVLAASAGRVPPRALDDYLLRTAELYLKANDPIRAGVILEFAKGRSRKKGLTGPRWAAVVRSVAEERRPSKVEKPAAPPEDLRKDEALLAAAHRAVEAARAVSGGAEP
jgi:hypothetical protein